MSRGEVYDKFAVPPHIRSQLEAVEVPESLKSMVIQLEDQIIKGDAKERPVGLLRSLK